MKFEIIHKKLKYKIKNQFKMIKEYERKKQ